MSLVPRSASAGPDASTAMYASQVPDLVAGEDIDAGAPCYIKAADGKAYMSNGAAANAAAKVNGFALKGCYAGQPVTLAGPGVRFGYGSGLTPGAPLYLAATAGRLDTAATTGGTAPIAFAPNATDIVFSALSL